MKPLKMKTLIMGLSFGFILAAGQVSEAGYETCYEQEYRCETRYENVCGYENRCHMVPGQQQCRPVQVCTPRPSTPNCQTVTECGTNAHGQQICKTREVCDGHTGGGQDCGYVQECSNSGPQQVCNQEYVCDSRPQQHCGYETVAKQCWVPDPQPPQPPPYYPPTPNPEPPPYHPPAPDPEPPYYPPTPDPEPPYYPPTPDPEPPYYPPTPQPPVEEPEEPGDIESQSISGLDLKITKAGDATVVFKDRGQSVTYRTRYFISIIDKSGVVIVNQHASADGKSQQRITLNQELSNREDHTLVLRVLRSGGELVKDVSFVKTVFRPAQN